MRIVDVGQGPPVVLVPGIQGRWEWMIPTVEALARQCRVITFSLADEPTSEARFDAHRGFDNYVQQIAEAMDIAGVKTAAICGVSYGGLIAATFAARHPDRVDALVLASAIPPTWRPDARVRFFLRAPTLLSPLFCISSLRLYPEIASATPGVLGGVRAALRHGWNAATHLFSPGRMARRVRLLEGIDAAGLAQVRMPVLVITGDPDRDRVVPVVRTHEYLRLWPHAQAATLERTGHLGAITRPAQFAQLVTAFLESGRAGHEHRRRVG